MSIPLTDTLSGELNDTEASAIPHRFYRIVEE